MVRGKKAGVLLNTVLERADGRAGFKPTDISDLYSWYDYSEMTKNTLLLPSRITATVDQSGNGIHLVGGAVADPLPVFGGGANGKDFARYDGVGNFHFTSMVGAGTNFAANAMFAVMRVRGNNPVVPTFMGEANAVDVYLSLLNHSTEVASLIAKNTAATIFTASAPAHVPGFEDEWFIFGYNVISATSRTAYNGKSAGTIDTADLLAFDWGAIPFIILGNDLVAKYPMDMEEICFFDAALSGADIISLVDYFQWKYNIPDTV